MQRDAVFFPLVWEVQVETLDVEPAVLLEVEDSGEFLVDFSVAVRPYSCFFQLQRGVHSRSEEISAVLLPEERLEGGDGSLHGFFEEHG